MKKVHPLVTNINNLKFDHHQYANAFETHWSNNLGQMFIFSYKIHDPSTCYEQAVYGVWRLSSNQNILVMQLQHINKTIQNNSYKCLYRYGKMLNSLQLHCFGIQQSISHSFCQFDFFYMTLPENYNILTLIDNNGMNIVRNSLHSSSFFQKITELRSWPQIPYISKIKPLLL